MPSPTRCIEVDDAVDFVREHCFTPSAHGLIGAELEWLTYPLDNPGSRIAPDRMASVLAQGKALPCGSAITFEPGGQVELSSLPYRGLAPVIAALAADADHLRRRLLDEGITTAPVGLDPLRPDDRVLHAPRYAAMEAYFACDGTAGRSMMCATASLQVNLDLGPPWAAPNRWRLASALGPTLAAMFANSPFVARCPSGFRSSRLAVWGQVDRSRAAPVSCQGDPAYAWARYALDARVMLIRACDDHYVPMGERLSFERWIVQGHPLGHPTFDDLAYHLTTLFPPVRPRRWLELRMLDALPDPLWRVALAVATALLDDAEAAAVAVEAARPAAGLWDEAARHGVAHPVLGASAERCIAAVLDALPRLGVDAATGRACARFADQYVARRRCPADDLLEAWGKDNHCLDLPDLQEVTQ